MKKFKKGDRFIHVSGGQCFISHIKKDEIRISFVDVEPATPLVWDVNDFEEAVKTSIFTVFPMPKINRENIAIHLIEYELNMVGKTLEEAKKSPTWYSDNNMTEEQYEMFKGYAIPLIKKVFRCSKKRAEETFKWFDFMYGIRVIKN
jgi:hypothetical protein